MKTLFLILLFISCGKNESKNQVEEANQKRIKTCNRMARSMGCTYIEAKKRTYFKYELHGEDCYQRYQKCLNEFGFVG
jgi:hypothetical protein